MSTQLTVKQFFESEGIQKHVKNLLGEKSKTFITSVLNIATNNEMLKDCEPASIYQSALVATTLDIPLNQNLGYAYIVPFNSRQKDGTYKKLAQFQIGYKGFIQLAQRSGQFLKIAESPIYEGQIISNNPLTGYEFDFNIKGGELIGYVAYFKLLNGYEATLYMTKDELIAHGKKFSQTFKKGFGLWQTDFESMARKTVLKLLLQRYAPMSIEMQKATLADQSIINDAETMDIEYTDNTQQTSIEVSEDMENQRIIDFIENAKTVKQLNEVQEHLTNAEQTELYTKKIENLKK